MSSRQERSGSAHLEIEAKFLVQDLESILIRLKNAHAQLVQERTHEYNLRFDTPAGDLAREHRVLRLRRGHDIRLTYKSPGGMLSGIPVRQEMELILEDFETARTILEALGYKVSTIYEKNRTFYSLGAASILLDELPFGNFVEIEAPSMVKICTTARDIGLDWKERITESYLTLFEDLRAKMSLQFRDLTFDNFNGLTLPGNAFNRRAT